jgi:hypothetical protein
MTVSSMAAAVYTHSYQADDSVELSERDESQNGILAGLRAWLIRGDSNTSDDSSDSDHSCKLALAIENPYDGDMDLEVYNTWNQ